MLEPALGRINYLLLYAASLLGGGLGVVMLDSGGITAGASGAVFGLLAAATVGLWRRGINPFSTGRSGRPDRRRRTLSLESLEPRALLSAVPFAARPDLVDASGLGFSARDNKTNDTTPTFEGTWGSPFPIEVRPDLPVAATRSW